MLKIVKKATEKRIGCNSNEVISTPLVKKDKSCAINATPVYQKIECGLNAFICGDGEMRKIP